MIPGWSLLSDKIFCPIQQKKVCISKIGIFLKYTYHNISKKLLDCQLWFWCKHVNIKREACFALRWKGHLLSFIWNCLHYIKLAHFYFGIWRNFLWPKFLKMRSRIKQCATSSNHCDEDVIADIWESSYLLLLLHPAAFYILRFFSIRCTLL